MLRKSKLFPDGHSWAVRLPKAGLELSGILPGSEIQLQIKQGRIAIYPGNKTMLDRFAGAKRDAKQTWNEVFEEVWFEIFGIDE